ncbi:hypothetical protein SAMN06893096_104143 [Geodermatophilus pulveris]|uniref:Uncharacterized protein n=1 Tax=Geodermatophilus pulveris TaxID=1564159 RepID=A0A239EIF8_9ACTN|nr:hypothetical protein [Geodermatophilus pulveris]SNS44407.1 hypothetical protein SAMN06893096_104143 [Geodermatophilus pulveris]
MPDTQHPDTQHPDGRPARPGHPAHRRPDPAARRRTRLLGLAVLAAAVLGLGAWLVTALVGDPATGGGAADPAAAPSAVPVETVALPPLPAVARMPDEQLRVTISDLEALVREDPRAVGPGAGEVLDSLRRVELLSGGDQRSAAVEAHDAVAAAVEEGVVAEPVARRVQEVLAAVVRPQRLIDLVWTVDVDPPAVGPAGPDLVDDLLALDHDVPADRTADRAAALLADVRAAAGRGELSPVFGDAAVPTLEQLADPAPYRALQDLRATAEADPDAVGPAADEVLASLRAIAELPVHPQGEEVAALLELVRRDGQVTAEFREAAVPVLVPLYR